MYQNRSEYAIILWLNTLLLNNFYMNQMADQKRNMGNLTIETFNSNMFFKKKGRSNFGLRSLTVCLTFVLLLLNVAKAQNSEFLVKDFHFEELTNIYTRNNLLSKYTYTKQTYTVLELSPEAKNNISQSIFSTIGGWNSLRFIPKMNKENVWINHELIAPLENEMENKQLNKRIMEQDPLRFSTKMINEMSLILTESGDTLVFIPVKAEFYNGTTGKTDVLQYLYYQKLDVIKRLCDLRKKVVQMEEHISILEKNGLYLLPEEIAAFNKNMQSRVIDSVKSFFKNIPEFYCVVSNKIESKYQNSFFKPSASAYLVLKYGEDNFISNKQKYQSFPSMKPELNSQLLMDSVELTFQMDALIKKIESIDYHEHFNKQVEQYDYWSQRDKRIFINTNYMKAIGYPEFDPLDTLYHTEENWWGPVSEFIKNKEQRPTKLAYEPFFEKHVSNGMGSRQWLISLMKTGENDKPTWYSLIQDITYNIDSFIVKVRLGDPTDERDYSYSFDHPKIELGIWAFDQKKLYDFYTGYMDFYLGESKKIEAIMNQTESAEAESEEMLQLKLNEKYGKKYVDAMLQLKIIVGMHEDLVNIIVSKYYYVGSTYSANNRNFYRLEPQYGTGSVSIWIENKKVTSVTYN